MIRWFAVSIASYLILTACSTPDVHRVDIACMPVPVVQPICKDETPYDLQELWSAWRKCLEQNMVWHDTWRRLCGTE